LELLDTYLAHLANERGLSLLTRENYSRDITILLGLAGDTPLDQLTRHTSGASLPHSTARDCRAKA
jgi:Phage integrase, N-terminal SAM-like domain.